jgi:hypothetical protein
MLRIVTRFLISANTVILKKGFVGDKEIKRLVFSENSIRKSSFE